MKYLNKKTKFVALYLFLTLSLFCLFISSLNLIISGQPRYWEIVHNKDSNNIEQYRIQKEKIIMLKKKNNKTNNDYLSVLSENYKALDYSGNFVNGNCGSIENGNVELIFKEDKYGFRENEDFRYIFSDYILLGDSFTQSICENKPNDLKSNLTNKSNYSFLNLGMQGTDYPDQAKKLIYYLENTKFNGLIWFFYEGNDYEKKSNDIEEFENYITPNQDNINYNIDINHKISLLFKLKVWLSEFIRGPVTLIKFFKNYNDLLDIKDYKKVHQEVKTFLDKKNIDTKILIYVPSWQKISLYKLKKFNLYDAHPQISQLNNLKASVKKISKEYNFKFIDGDDYFLSIDNPLSVFHYELNTHFNKKGNELLSNIVLENLKN